MFTGQLLLRTLVEKIENLFFWLLLFLMRANLNMDSEQISLQGFIKLLSLLLWATNHLWARYFLFSDSFQHLLDNN